MIDIEKEAREIADMRKELVKKYGEYKVRQIDNFIERFGIELTMLVFGIVFEKGGE